MKTKVLNDELVVSFQDEFAEMSEEEMKKQAFVFGLPQLCISDPQRHMIVSAGVQTINGFSAMMLNAKDIAKKMESQISAPMKQYGYKLEGFVTEKIGDKTAEGLRYSYTAQDIEMSSESLAVKEGKKLYYIHCYYRSALKEESLKVFAEILAASSWK